MSNEERFWESVVAEAVADRPPPDQTAEILARLNAPDALPSSATRRSAWRRISAHAASAALAACLLLVIGLATGVVQWPGEVTPNTPPEVRNLIAAPDAQWTPHDDHVELASGALLLSTGAPEVRSAEGNFKQLDGLALVRTGNAPDEAEFETLKTWLQQKGVERNMITMAKRWFIGTTLSVLMLQGSALLDGSPVQAQGNAAPVDWHYVNSVMDLEELPAGTKAITISDRQAALLEFAAEIPSIEAIEFLNGNDLRLEHIQALKRLPRLTYLDLRGTYWVDKPDYRLLLELKGLKSVGLDVECRFDIEGFEYGVDETIPVLQQLSERGVEVRLGSIDCTEEIIAKLTQALPGIVSLKLHGATNHNLKQLTTLKSLTDLELHGLDGDEIGLAYVARNIKLKRLVVRSDGMQLTHFHQFSRMTTLTELSVSGQTRDSFEHCVAKLKEIKELKRLNLDLSFRPVSDMNNFSTMRGLPALDYLRLGHRTDDSGGIRPMLEALSELNASTVEIEAYSFEAPKQALPPEGNSRVEQLVLVLNTFEWPKGQDVSGMQSVIAANPKLKRIELRRADRYSVEGPTVDELLAWLRKSAPKVEVVYKS